MQSWFLALLVLGAAQASTDQQPMEQDAAAAAIALEADLAIGEQALETLFPYFKDGQAAAILHRSALLEFAERLRNLTSDANVLATATELKTGSPLVPPSKNDQDRSELLGGGTASGGATSVDRLPGDFF
mmetsp:Transcript_8638/g.19854  ORF Transcript_8638/g.19854 Transcript_8638/m.19854 type:complete len:130 (+) Transcript_8638:2-391(+)